MKETASSKDEPGLQETPRTDWKTHAIVSVALFAAVVVCYHNALGLARAGHDARMLLQVHDELVFYLHKDEHLLVPQIREVMENVYPSFTNMALTTSYGISDKSWGDIG